MLSSGSGIVLSTLGPLRAVGADGTELALGGPKQRAVLASLLLQPNTVMSSDRIIENVWGPEPADGGAATLQVYIYNLRRALAGVDGVAIVTRRPGYALEVAAEAVDHLVFEALAAQAAVDVAAGRMRDAIAGLDRALDLWRGRALDDLLDYDWAFHAAARFEEQRVAVTEQRNGLRLAVGDLRGLATDLEGQVRENPLRERLWAQLMLVLYRDGRQRDALAAFERVRAVLLDELGLDPGPELRDVQQAILRQDPALRADTVVPEGAAPGGLPEPLSPLVGRRAELVALTTLVGEHPVVTVVGPPGSGKTRLVVDVARALADAGRTCAYLDVSTIEQGDEVERAVDDAISALAAHLSGRGGGVVVLDGCERLLHRVAPVVNRWRTASRSLHVLATSQVALGLADEAVFALDALPVPESTGDAGDAEALAAVDSVRLFVARAGTTVPGFGITPVNATSVARIVTILDGLPLAIELAAAQVRYLSVAELARQLDEGLDLLVAPAQSRERYRTLRDALSWSVGSLDDESLAALLALSTLVGPFSLDDAVAVCAGDSGQIVRKLIGLVDRSLVGVLRDVDHGLRYRILEPIRRIAALDLVASGSAYDVRARHAGYFIAMATTAGPLDRQWPRTMRRIADNVMAALRFTVESGDTSAAVRAAVCLCTYQRQRGSLESAHAALRAVLPMLPSMDPPDAMDLSLAAGSLAIERGDSATALTWAGNVAAQATSAGDGRRMAYALIVEAAAHRETGKHDMARARLATALELFDNSADITGTALALGQLGMLARLQGDADVATGLLSRGLSLLSSVRGAAGGRSLLDMTAQHRGRSLLLSELGAAASGAGQLDAAGEFFTESLLVSAAADHRSGVAATLEAIAVLGAQRQQADAAATLLGAIEGILDASGDSAPRRESSRLEAALIAAAGFDRVRDRMRLGRTLTVDQAVRLGVEICARGSAAPDA